jgi:transcriptional regulator with XRE-family HTH domain
MRTPTENISAEQRELAQRLRAAREDQGLSQQYVANLTGIARSAISEIECGRRRVDCLELAKLARVYLRPVSDFFAEDAGPAAGVIARISGLLVQQLSSEDQDTIVALLRLVQHLSSEDQDTIVAFARFLRYRARSVQREMVSH